MVTILRNPLGGTAMWKSVLVSVIGNITAPKFLGDMLSLVSVTPETPEEVGPLKGAVNTATGSLKETGEMPIDSDDACKSIPIGLMKAG